MWKIPIIIKLKMVNFTLTATKTGDNAKGGYTSTRLSSQGKKEFKYGRIEFRAKMPKGEEHGQHYGC